MAAGNKQATGDLDPAGPPPPTAAAAAAKYPSDTKTDGGKRRKATTTVAGGVAPAAKAPGPAPSRVSAPGDVDVIITGEITGDPDEDADSVLASDLLAARGIYVHALSDRGAVLATLCPSFVVVYDPDAAFIREVEVHKARRPGAPLRVYFLVHDTSLEEQRYLSAVRHETESVSYTHLTLPTILLV